MPRSIASMNHRHTDPYNTTVAVGFRQEISIIGTFLFCAKRAKAMVAAQVRVVSLILRPLGNAVELEGEAVMLVQGMRSSPLPQILRARIRRTGHYR